MRLPVWPSTRAVTNSLVRPMTPAVLSRHSACLLAARSLSVGSAAVTESSATRGAGYLPRTIASLLSAPGTQGEGNIPGNGKSRPAENDVVTINGWIRSVRKMGKVAFAHISDGSTSIPLQVVLSKPQAAGLTTGSSIEVTGLWKPSLPGTQQKNEVQAHEVRILGEADPETYPIQKKYQTPEFLRSLPHLRPRVPLNAALLRLRSATTSFLTQFFEEREFVQVYPPIITSSDCEGGGETFTVSVGSSLHSPSSEGMLPKTETESSATSTPSIKAATTSNHNGGAASVTSHFFKTPKYLTVSTQLHLEALAAALPRVWTLSPTFRAERSDTNRHLSEFYMLEAEVSFIENLDPLLDLTEDMIKHVVTNLRSSLLGKELLSLTEGSSSSSTTPGDQSTSDLPARWDALLGPVDPTTLKRWTRITYTDAIAVLQDVQKNSGITFNFPPEWGAGLQSEHEKFLAQHFSGPVFVTDYPRGIKPFYMLSNESSVPGRETVACFDLLLPGVGEIIGGSLREHRYEKLLENMKQHGLIPEGGSVDEAGLKWYAELRKWGSVPHGGFGLGMDRLLVYLTGLENVRESSAFPRWAGRCDC